MSLSGLPVIDAAEAELRRVAIAALTGPRVGGEPLAAHVAHEPDRRGGWLCFEGGAALALDRLDGAPVRFGAADSLGAVALLERAEPLVAAIEAALGLSLDPVELSDEPPVGLIVTVMQGQRAALRLVLPTTLALLPAPVSFAPELAGHLTLPASIRLDGPRLAPHDAAGLEPGDLLLLGTGPLVATLGVGEWRVPGTLDPAAPAFRAAKAFGAP